MLEIIVPIKDDLNGLIRLQNRLEGLSNISDIHIIDSPSTKSKEIQEFCLEKGLLYKNFIWDGKYPKKRNWALMNIEFKSDIILFLDSDELVTQENINEIIKIFKDPAIGVVYFEFNNIYKGKLLKFGVKFKKSNCLRLGNAFYEKVDEENWSKLDMEVHEQILTDLSTANAVSKIEHHEFKSLHHYISKHNEYSEWEAKNSINKTQSKHKLTFRQKVKYSLIKTPFLGIVYFLWDYIFLLGFLNGRYGLRFSILKAFYFYLIYCKITDESKPNNTNFQF